MRRREFITLVGGTVVWPRAAHAQQPARVRRIGVIMGLASRDREALRRVKALESSWQELGWVEGRNMRVDYHWATGDAAAFRSDAAALVAAEPDVILAAGTSVLAAVRQTTQSIPIVFVGISDPEGTGVVASLSRPGGHITGFANFEPATAGKWLQVLKEIAPDLRRVAVLRARDGLKRFVDTISASAPSFGVEILDCNIRGTDDIEPKLGSIAAEAKTGLIMLPDPIVTGPRRMIIDLLARHRIPAIYPLRIFPDEGGLISYGIDLVDQCRRAAFYIDRILKGEQPAVMPVQAPTKFEMVINLKTAKALGLAVPAHLLASSDEVIE